MAKFVVPSNNEVEQMISMLYEGDVEVAESSTLSTEPGSKIVVAVFVDDDDNPVSSCVCDFSFAAYAGAALTMIPKGGAEDAAETGEFSETLRANIYEVMNILTRLFMNPNTPHLRITKVFDVLDDAPEDVQAMLSAADKSVGYTVSVPNYGSGELTFVTT